MSQIDVLDADLRRQRLAALARHPSAMGIAGVEVGSSTLGRVDLLVAFVPGEGPGAGKPARPAVAVANVGLRGADGNAARRLRVLAVGDAADRDDTIVVTLAVDADRVHLPTDTFVLALVAVADIDPFFASAPFRLVPEHRNLTPGPIPTPGALEDRELPVVDYLARDDASFRDLMSSRLAASIPAWSQTSPADVGQVLVEVLAHAADQLSYFQDAVATEAYLGTARRRVSVRRHTRLVDYALHEGCNARVWAQVQVTSPLHLAAGTRLVTRVEPLTAVVLDDVALEAAVAAGATVFETMHGVDLVPGNEQIALHDWGLAGYRLEPGATTGALIGDHPTVQTGTVLILEAAALSPSDDQGLPRRWAVRLTGVERGGRDPLTPGPGGDPGGLPLTLVTWGRRDALPFALTISTPGGHSGVAHGNLVLADHGLTLPSEELAPPPTASASYRPRLRRAGLTWSEPFAAAPDGTATDAVIQDVRAAVPAIVGLTSRTGPTDVPQRWTARRDLLDSDRLSYHVVVEMEEDGVARLRFGDGVHGRPAPVGGRLSATYRVGNGAAGNIGREALAALAPPSADRPAVADAVVGVTNPVGARGGVDPEPLEQARLFAPVAYQEQRRAVTEDDFVAVALRHPLVRAASAQFRWTGSWYTAVVVVERRDGLAVDETFEHELLMWFEPFRLAGSDIAVRGPVVVGVDIDVAVTAEGLPPATVAQSLEAAFAPGAFFAPDAFSLGLPLYLSQLVARAMAVPGVATAEVIRFQRADRPPEGELDLGVIQVGASEVVRVAAGQVRFHVQGRS